MLDQLAIRELHELYADAVLRCDPVAWGGCWADDGEWHIMGQVIRGRDQIVPFWTAAMARYQSVSFIAVPGPIVVDGEVASGRSQTHELFHEVSGARYFIAGAYDDRFVKRDGQWLFSGREYRIVGQFNIPPES